LTRCISEKLIQPGAGGGEYRWWPARQDFVTARRLRQRVQSV